MEPIIDLSGFEEAIEGLIASDFHFTRDTVRSGLDLTKGRNLFSNDMPEDQEIVKTSKEFNKYTEPVISIYSNGGTPIGASVSSGSRHEWIFRIVIRFGVVFEDAKELLEDLVAWLVKFLRGRRAGRHKVKGVFIVSRPGPFQRAGDDAAYCTATLRFLAVPIP